MLNEDKDQIEESEEEEDDDEGREFKTIPIAEAIQIQKRIRKEKQEEFERKLAKIKERTDRLKRELEEERKKREQ
ncbi:hypothetical protein ACS2QQ_27410 [Bacillus cereus group sp. Bce032]|uniref:hypothetical protein n=1 Tax=Bacillus cereus group sp. Bce032 TaxID=3445236 RepID=UPI003F29CDE2